MNLADCYRLLGLRTGASFEEIKVSYRRLARQYHPDVNPSHQQQAKEKFIQLTEAYKYLISVVQPSEPTQAPTNDSKPAPPPAQTTSPPAVKVTRKPPIEIDQDISATDRQLKQGAYEQLQQFLKNQRYPRAIALVEGLAQRLPQDREVRQWQAITYQRFGHHLANNNQADKARVYLKKALRTDPHNKALWYEVERDFRKIEQIL
jgi:tetratricopeptide (TPR) repeat protein